MLVFCMQNVVVGQLDITHTAWQTIYMCDVDIIFVNYAWKSCF